MPEGHTIHRAARDHRRLLGAQLITASSPQGRFADSAARIDGRCLEGVEPWGKHLFYWWDSGEVLHVHLGLFGRFTVHSVVPPPEPVGAIRLRLQGSRATIDLSGPTECRLDGPEHRDAVVARLGPDPLRSDADPERFVAKVARSRTSIGRLLMDQSVIAGVGNVYRAEALFLLGLHPELPGKALGEECARELWATVVRLLADGFRRGRIVTVDPAMLDRPISRIGRGEGTWVYKQPACRRCATPVRRWDMGGRWCYACETCQLPPAPP